MVDFLHDAQKRVHFFKVLVVLPPSGKLSAGAHGKNYMYYVLPARLKLGCGVCMWVA